MNNYYLLHNWPNLPANFKLGSPTGLCIDNNQNIYLLHRADRVWTSTNPIADNCIASKTILLVDGRNGKIINSWGDHLFMMPHGLKVDLHNNIWVTDVSLHQVFKFSANGKLMMTVGEAKLAGNDAIHFNMPTDIAIANDGSFYVSDGYGNNRIVKFSFAGEYLFEWGIYGNKEGEFNLPHAIDIDSDGNIYVADRENKRVQVFDAAGKFIQQWTDDSFGKISSVAVDKVKKSFIAVGYFTSPSDEVLGSEITIFDERGKVIRKMAQAEGRRCWYHNIAVDKYENIYVTDILGNRIFKFEKMEGSKNVT